jgi:hypothetical protein
MSTPSPIRRLAACALALLPAACSTPDDAGSGERGDIGIAAPRSSDASRASARTADDLTQPPLAGLEPADDLIRPDEKHFARLWRVTRDVENAAEGYWSFGGDRLVYQATPRDAACDRIYLTPRGSGAPELVSSGRGVTTCAYFLPGDASILYASTHAFQHDCPERADMSQGYVWQLHPEYDVYLRDLASGRERALTSTFGYDAEATVSPRGDRIVFTSSRSGDLELWTANLDGTDLVQVTNTPGYDGGAFFSNDGGWLIFRSTVFTEGQEEQEIADYRRLLGEWKVRPTRMEIMKIRPDGSGRARVTDLGKANFAPSWFPGDRRILFASNHADPSRQARNFDVYAIDVDGQNLERITSYESFDGFPMFAPGGRWLAFASNRGGSDPRETNLYVAEWR